MCGDGAADAIVDEPGLEGVASADSGRLSAAGSTICNFGTDNPPLTLNPVTPGGAPGAKLSPKTPQEPVRRLLAEPGCTTDAGSAESVKDPAGSKQEYDFDDSDEEEEEEAAAVDGPPVAQSFDLDMLGESIAKGEPALEQVR